VRPTQAISILGTTLAVAALAACGTMTVENPFAVAPTSLRVDEAGSGAPVVLARGQTMAVVLEANVPTGYRWEVTPGFAPTLAQVGTADYTARATPPVVGAPGDMTFRFRAENPGTTSLTFTYRRPFEPDVAPAKSVRYDVTVR
jgi:inhibitor of cysteine peptidase